MQPLMPSLYKTRTDLSYCMGLIYNCCQGQGQQSYLLNLHRVDPLVLIHGSDHFLLARLHAGRIYPISNPVAVKLLEGFLISLPIALPLHMHK